MVAVCLADFFCVTWQLGGLSGLILPPSAAPPPPPAVFEQQGAKGPYCLAKCGLLSEAK